MQAGTLSSAPPATSKVRDSKHLFRLRLPHNRPKEREVQAGWGAGFSGPPFLDLILSREDGSWSEDRGRQVTGDTPATKGVADELSTPSYGRLVKAGDREYRLTFYYVLMKAGLVNGFARIQSNEVCP